MTLDGEGKKSREKKGREEECSAPPLGEQWQISASGHVTTTTAPIARCLLSGAVHGLLPRRYFPLHKFADLRPLRSLPKGLKASGSNLHDDTSFADWLDFACFPILVLLFEQ